MHVAQGFKAVQMPIGISRHTIFSLCIAQARGLVYLDDLDDWFNDIWPNLIEMIYSQLMEQAHDQEHQICKYCGNPWQPIGFPKRSFGLRERSYGFPKRSSGFPMTC